jgi:pimeloyl-ACP methyl ester carboxylesterase
MMGDTDFDTFYASQVGHNTNYKIMEPMLRKAARSLLTKTGPAYLVTHSQSGPLGWHIADECPDLVRGIVTLEPHGPPFEYPDAAPFNKQLQLVGTLLHPFGITSTPLHFSPSLDAGATQLSYERSTIPENNGLVSGCRQKRPPRQLVNLASIPVLLVTAEASYHASYDHLMADFLRDAGVPVEHVYLAEKGIRGNGHLMAIEANNDEIQRFINEWLIQTEGLRSRN